MKSLLASLAAVATLGLWTPGTLTVHAQTLPVTRTLAWDQLDAVTDAITGYVVVFDGTTLPTVPPCNPDPLTCSLPLTFTSAGSHTVTVQAVNLWGTSVVASLTVTVVLPGKAGNVRIK